jgi:hypothetical protein
MISPLGWGEWLSPTVIIALFAGIASECVEDRPTSNMLY